MSQRFQVQHQGASAATSIQRSSTWPGDHRRTNGSAHLMTPWRKPTS